MEQKKVMKKHIWLRHIKVKQASEILISNFCLCLIKEMIMKNFRVVIKKMYLRMHIKEKCLLSLYANVCISITLPSPLPGFILSKSSLSHWHSYEKEIKVGSPLARRKVKMWKYITSYQVLEYSTQMSWIIINFFIANACEKYFVKPQIFFEEMIDFQNTIQDWIYALCLACHWLLY